MAKLFFLLEIAGQKPHKEEDELGDEGKEREREKGRRRRPPTKMGRPPKRVKK